MRSGVRIRPADGHADFAACVTLQREVWGLSDLEVTSAIQLIATVHAGGLLLIAEDEARHAVGFCYAFAGFDGRDAYLHSDMLAVRPEARGRGVGRQLKWAQREEALRRGLRLVQWTFDPMRARNARLNLHHLGATAREYRSDLYGRTSSALHLGLPTDRLLARWELDSPRVARLAAGAPPEPSARGDGAGRAIEIPADWDAIAAADPARASEWQARVRRGSWGRSRTVTKRWTSRTTSAVAPSTCCSGPAGSDPESRSTRRRRAQDLCPSCPPSGSLPTATGRPGSDDHSLHEPA